MAQLYISTDSLEAAALTINGFEREIGLISLPEWEDTLRSGKTVRGLRTILAKRGYVFNNFGCSPSEIDLQKRIGFVPMCSVSLVNNSERELRDMAKKLVLEGLYAHLEKDDGKSESFIPKDAEARKKLAMISTWPEKNKAIRSHDFYQPCQALIVYSNGFGVRPLVGDNL
jgi:hypothetical protein